MASKVTVVGSPDFHFNKMASEYLYQEIQEKSQFCDLMFICLPPEKSITGQKSVQVYAHQMLFEPKSGMLADIFQHIRSIHRDQLICISLENTESHLVESMLQIVYKGKVGLVPQNVVGLKDLMSRLGLIPPIDLQLQPLQDCQVVQQHEQANNHQPLSPPQDQDKLDLNKQHMTVQVSEMEEPISPRLTRLARKRSLSNPDGEGRYLRIKCPRFDPGSSDQITNNLLKTKRVLFNKANQLVSPITTYEELAQRRTRASDTLRALRPIQLGSGSKKLGIKPIPGLSNKNKSKPLTGRGPLDAKPSVNRYENPLPTVLETSGGSESDLGVVPIQAEDIQDKCKPLKPSGDSFTITESDAQFNSLPATEQSQVAAVGSGIFSLEHSEFEEAVIVKFVKGDQQAMNNNDAFNNNEYVSDKKAVKDNQAVSDKKANKDNQAVKTQTAAKIRKNSEVEKSEDAFVLPSSKSNSAYPIRTRRASMRSQSLKTSPTSPIVSASVTSPTSMRESTDSSVSESPMTSSPLKASTSKTLISPALRTSPIQRASVMSPIQNTISPSRQSAKKSPNSKPLMTTPTRRLSMTSPTSLMTSFDEDDFKLYLSDEDEPEGENATKVVVTDARANKV